MKQKEILKEIGLIKEKLREHRFGDNELSAKEWNDLVNRLTELRLELTIMNWEK
jgi:hypothetical protein